MEIERAVVVCFFVLLATTASCWTWWQTTPKVLIVVLHTRMFSLSSGSLSTKFLSCPFLLDAIFMPQNEPMKIQEWFSMHSAHGHSSHEIKGRYRAYKHYCLHEEKNVLQSCNNWVAKNVNFCLLVRKTDFLASWFLTFAIPLSGGEKDCLSGSKMLKPCRSWSKHSPKHQSCSNKIWADGRCGF